LIVVSLSASSVSAQNIIYDKPYGGSKVGRVENNGVFYDKAYDGSSIGRIDEKGFIKMHQNTPQLCCGDEWLKNFALEISVAAAMNSA
jgi:hypothetical protein